MLTIHCNDNFHKEREYIYDVIFGDFWNIEYVIRYEERDDIKIEVDGRGGLYIADTFLQMPFDKWLSKDSLPAQPLQKIKVPEEYVDCVTDLEFPVIYGEIINRLFSEDGIRCYLDIFGSALFMLTRYEEVVKQERDKYDRFSAFSSLAYQEGFLERPIINEYLEILWHWLRKNFPGLRRKDRKFSIMPTHDVDNPFWCLTTSLNNCLHMLVGDVLKRRDLGGMCEHLCNIKNAIIGNFSKDPFNTFELIMNISEKYGLTSNFYFMTAKNRDEMDGNYDIMHPEVIKLVKNIIGRGHKVGIHPGFGSKDSVESIKQDADKLRKMINNEKISVENFGGRQHYLHWSAPLTWAYYEQAGIIYDSTLSFADHIGFRCGICYDYPVYNVVTHSRYKIREYPLAVMDGTGLPNRGDMNLSYEEMVIRCRALKEKVRKYEGIFVILWHNTCFLLQEDVTCYNEILR